jgi:hypothetical protein
MDNTLLINTRKAFLCLFNTIHTNIAWAIRNSLKYPKDFNMAETF